ncbi:MAG: hypothetical protein QOH90_1189 [Actinomycetota bacterium]|nr:hypothetical protein [Actinomycetota bacterium]
MTVALAATIVIAGLALADSKTINDGNDSSTGADMKTASHGHTNSGKLKHKITTYNAYDAKHTPCLQIDAGGSIYRICQKTLTNLTSGESSTITYRHPTSKSTVYIFSKGAIGSPGKYKWQAQTFGTGCGEAPCDSVPNTGFVTHTL